MARCGLSDCAGEYLELANGINQPRPIAIDDTHVYFGTHQSGGDTVRRVPKGGGSVEILSDQEDDVMMLRVHDGYLYWPNETDTGTVRRVPTSGALLAEDVATGLADPRSIAIGGGCIFITDTDRGEIRSVPLPVTP